MISAQLHTPCSNKGVPVLCSAFSSPGTHLALTFQKCRQSSITLWAGSCKYPKHPLHCLSSCLWAQTIVFTWFTAASVMISTGRASLSLYSSFQHPSANFFNLLQRASHDKQFSTYIGSMSNEYSLPNVLSPT
jgi:hypothetical protein